MILPIPDIIDQVCVWFHVTAAEMQSSSRRQSLVIPRQVVMYIAYKHTCATFEEIGQFLGGRDHTTIMHGCKATERRMIELDRWGQTLLLDVRRIEGMLMRARPAMTTEMAYV